MKKLITFLILAITIISCNKHEPKTSIKEDVEISLSFTLYDCNCDGMESPTVEIVGGSIYTYHPNDIPNEIKDQPDWQNKEYIATLKIKDETCECILGIDPIPGNEAPKEDLKKAVIIKIRKK